MSAERPYLFASDRQDPAATAAALLPAGSDLVTWDSTGDTAFEMLLQGAKRVRVATGPGGAPLLALKVAALRALPGPGVRDLLGAGPIGRRIWFYHSVRALLPASDRAWWDNQERVIREGVLGGGRWERHLEGFRTRALPRVHGAALIQELLALREEDARRAFVRARWRTMAWRAAVAAWFAGGLHRPGPVLSSRGPAFEARTHSAMMRSFPGDSPHLVWWLTGAWTGGRGSPRWLTDAGLAALRERIDQVSVTGPEELGPVDGVDLHEAWDTTPPARRGALLAHVSASLRPGGRLLLRTEDAAPAMPAGLRSIPVPRPDASPFASPALLLEGG